MMHCPTISMTNRFAYAAAAAALFGGLAARAPGDVTDAEWHSDDDFHYNVNYMPDLDQKRIGLDLNGNMHCVPTSTMNMLAYAAEWGVDDMDPGPGVWQGDVGYAAMTNFIEQLGDDMGTDDDGTNSAGWENGTNGWISGFPLSCETMYKHDGWCPTLGDAGVYAAYGALVSVCYGRYNFNAGPIPVLGGRTSGHCVTMIHAFADGDDTDMELWTRDPADSSDIYTQSPWAYRIYSSVENKTVYQDWDDDSAYDTTDVTVLEYDPDGEKMYVLDTVFGIFPSAVFSFDHVVMNIQPIADDFWLGQPPVGQIRPPLGFAFEDVEVLPGLQYYLVLMSGPHGAASLALADRATGAITELFTEISGLGSEMRIAVGRHRDVYVLSGNLVHKIALGLRGGEPRIVRTVPLASGAQAIAYNDATDEVVVLSTTNPRLTVLPESLEGGFEYPLPILPPSPEASMAVRSNGDVAVVVPTNPEEIYGIQILEPGGGVLVFHQPIGGRATSVAFDDREHLLVGLERASILELAPKATCSWCWKVVPAAESWYGDMQIRGSVGVTRSRTTFDPVINKDDRRDTPADELEELGVKVYDCPGDFDNDGGIAFNDLLVLLTKWGPCTDCPEDLDGDDLVGFGDILALLGAWGGCAN